MRKKNRILMGLKLKKQKFKRIKNEEKKLIGTKIEKIQTYGN